MDSTTDGPAPLYSTLATALGNLGGRQKSWMTTTSAPASAPHPPPMLSRPPAPKRSRGRPCKYPELVPPSASASPLLTSIASPSPAESSTHTHITVLPSPSPSEDTTAAVITPSTARVFQHDTPSIPSPYAPSGQPPPPPITHAPLAPHTISPISPQSMGEWYTAQDCWDALNRFERAVAAQPGHPCNTRRLNVIKDAIRHEDWAYLTLHQYYCLLSHEKAAVPVALRAQPKLPQAIKLLQDVLGHNSQLSSLHLSFFATFPAPIGILSARWPVMFQKQGLEFLLFVMHAPDHDMLRLTCLQNLHPPLSVELELHYKITSPLFQRLLFTSCLRCICQTLRQSYLHQTYETEALAIFDQSRAAFSQRERILGTPKSLQIQELAIYGRKLQKLFEKHKAIVEHNYLTATPWPSEVQLSRPQNHSIYRPTPTLPLNHSPGEDRTAMPGAMQQTRARGRPPNRPVLHTNFAPSYQPRPPHRDTPITQSQITPLPAHEPSRPGVSLLPPPGWLQPQQRVPHPTRFSMHQAHLRSPVLQTSVPSPPLYCFQQDYLIKPSRLSEAVTGIETLSFTLTAAQLETIARHVTTESGHCTRPITEKSKIIRLRCIQYPAANMFNENDWATADTVWIPYSYFTFNNTSLQQRRKVHHGKDQPIDLTHLVREGSNTVQITVMSPTTENSHLNYLVAVEVLGFKSHDAIKHTCLNSRRISASAMLDTIKQKLGASGQYEDEGDLAIVASNLTISLFDPFSASAMCTIPVRSYHCSHHDCFDLDTYLSTRPRRGDASAPDAWRCPICNADARPSRLIVDGFLEEVMSELQNKGMGDTRSIVVGADGVWTPKAQTREGVSDDTPPPEKRWADKEIIDLSD